MQGLIASVRPSVRRYLHDGVRAGQRQDPSLKNRQCLTDRSLPRDVRIAGALTRLYALALTRIVELTAGDLHRDADNAYLTISLQPMILPPSLAQLIDEQIAATTPQRLLADAIGYLLPGRRPGRARNPAGLADTMRQHGLPVRAARNTAMMQSLADLPPIVIADPFGIAPGTVYRWAQLAGNSWSDYLAACLIPQLSPGRADPGRRCAATARWPATVAVNTPRSSG